jgi:hypothetical protein
MTDEGAETPSRPGGGRRRPIVRAGVFAFVSAVLAGLVSLLPPGADDEAIVALTVVGVFGGSLARSAAEVLALVAGGTAGALLVGAATFGGPTGPSSMGSLLFGVAITAALLLVCAACARWLVPQLGPQVPRARQRRIVLAMFGTGVVMLVAAVAIAWGGAALGAWGRSSTMEDKTPSEVDTSRIAGSPGASSPAASVDLTACGQEYTHQAPDVEAVLPNRVGGRDLTVWSVAGLCWLKLAAVDAAAYDQLVQFAEGQGIDMGDLRYAIAGRSDTADDPPYFVFAIAKPTGADAKNLAVKLLFAGASFKNATVDDLSAYAKFTIAGREVYVGNVGMVAQSEHIRGTPYLIDTPKFGLVVVTDDPAWAEDAISQLPE